MYLLTAVVVLSCLAANAHGAPRIIGGHDAPNHKYPYQVSLQGSSGHFCSGSILNKQYILTAAHCVYTKSPVEFKIMVGSNFLRNETGEVYKADKIIVHENYEHFYHNDIALIKTIGEIVFNDNVTSIGVPDEDIVDYNDVTAVFSGWGVTDLRYPFVPDNLQEIELNLVSIEECREKLVDQITSKHICTYNKISEGICFGDSGGPLVLNGVQIGIASFVFPCAVGHPDAYTRVYSYREWLENKMKNYEKTTSFI